MNVGLRLALTLVAALLICTIWTVSGAPDLSYFIEVQRDGNASVTLVVTDSGGSHFYTYLPRFERWEYIVWSGQLLNVTERETQYYFYKNVSFSYLAGGSDIFGMNISFAFPFASLCIGDRGWFMSPLLGAPPEASVKIRVKVSGLAKILDVTLNDAPITYRSSGESIWIDASSRGLATGGRVVINYKLSEPLADEVFEFSFNRLVVKVASPPLYRGFAGKIANITSLALPKLGRYLGYSPDTVEYKFFLPAQLGLSALGYVIGEDINVGGEGAIHLNLALLRFKEGYLEATVLHELVHKALGAAGVPANQELRWFHEGVAQYVSLRVCEELGLDVSDEESSLESAIWMFKQGLAKPGFIQRWTPSGNEASYYAASYFVISELAKPRGGMAFIEAVVREIRKRGGVKNNQDLISAISSAAGEDLSSLFAEWGFSIERPAGARRNVAIVAALALIAAVAFSLYIILRQRERAKCPFCYAEIQREAVYCPYCGYPLKQGERSGLTSPS